MHALVGGGDLAGLAQVPHVIVRVKTQARRIVGALTGELTQEIGALARIARGLHRLGRDAKPRHKGEDDGDNRECAGNDTGNGQGRAYGRDGSRRVHGGCRGKGGAGLGLNGRCGLSRGGGLRRMLGLSRSGRVRRSSGRRLDLMAANRAETSAVVDLGVTTGAEHIEYLLGIKQQVVQAFEVRTTIFTAAAAKLLRNFQLIFKALPSPSPSRSNLAG